MGKKAIYEAQQRNMLKQKLTSEAYQERLETVKLKS